MVSFANPAAARVLGAAAASLTGKPVHDLLHGSAPPNRQCGQDCALRRATKNHTPASGKTPSFGQTDFVPGRVFPHAHSRPGPLFGFSAELPDISQRYTLDRLKDEFISTVSHELRTPLTSIRGALGCSRRGFWARSTIRQPTCSASPHQFGSPGPPDQRHSRPGTDPERARATAFRNVQLAEIVGQAIDGMAPVAEAPECS